tara:strand:- start:1705 stop:1962 length:258 start_codon:yes stop_codon:yes gene_type:complete
MKNDSDVFKILFDYEMKNDFNLLEYNEIQKTAISYENYIYEIVEDSGYTIPKETLKKIKSFRQDKEKMKLLYYSTKKLIEQLKDC